MAIEELHALKWSHAVRGSSLLKSVLCALPVFCSSGDFLLIRPFLYSLLFPKAPKYHFIDFEYCAGQVNKTGIILLIYSPNRQSV